MKYIPTYIVTKFLDINFTKLYESGKRIILTDLDNTLVSYFESIPNNDLIKLNSLLREMGFKIYIISNNNHQRVETFIKEFKVDGYLSHAYKPYAFKLNSFLRKNNLNKQDIIFIGDQLLTDIKCANKAKLDSVLVKSLSRSSEKWYTTINRKREKFILRRIKKIDINKYEEIERLINNE